MAEKDRITINGKPQNFTCTNSRFRTDTNSGQKHGNHSVIRGAALEAPLAEHNSYTLWLEHVIDQKGGKFFWLMWYQDGIPKIPMSGILTEEDLREMGSQLMQFVQFN